MPGCQECVLEIEVDVGEAGIFLFLPEPESLAFARGPQDEGNLRTVGMCFEVLDP